MSDEEKLPDKPKVLILGGCGFIGRHLVKYLVEKDVASEIKIADKLIPQTSFWTDAMIKYFKNPKVKMLQVDLSREDLIDKKEVFKHPVDYIFNLCGETKFGQTDKDYQVKCLDTGLICAKYATKLNIKKWIEVSTAQIYESQKDPALTEKAPIAPWTKLAEYRYKLEQELIKSKLPLIILRPSIVYGPGDKTGIMPRIVCAAGYKHRNEKMIFLWTANLRINTVHVRDVAEAMWITAKESKPGSIYNLSDHTNTTQGTINPMLEKLFGIKTDYQSAAMNKGAKQFMDTVATISNDKHMPMWGEVCSKHKISQSPLTPYIDQEILTKNHLCIDGRLIEKETSFKYKFPKVTIDLVQEMIDEYIQQGFFPKLNAL